LIARFENEPDVDLTESYCVPLPSLIFLNILGAPLEDLDFFLAIKEQTIHAKGNTGEEIAANAAIGGAKLIEYFTSLLEHRRAQPASSSDLIGYLMSAEVDGERISDEQLIDILFVIMLAGLDTVAGMLTLLFSHLARHADLRDTVVDDPSKIPAVIEEIMRYQTPVPAVNRYATEDIDLGDGLVVRKGEVMHAMLAGANVDERAFPCPLDVDPDRPRRGHIAFASGVHRCLGSHLARAEMRIALEEFHRRFPRYRLKDGASPRHQNVTIRMVHDLVVELAPLRVA
jgi:cytochrome P450